MRPVFSSPLRRSLFCTLSSQSHTLYSFCDLRFRLNSIMHKITHSSEATIRFLCSRLLAFVSIRARARHRRRYRELSAFTYILASCARLSFAPRAPTVAGVRQSASALPFVSFRSADRKTKSSAALTRDSTPWPADSAESKQNERMAARKQKNKIITLEAFHQKGENNNDSRGCDLFPAEPIVKS